MGRAVGDGARPPDRQGDEGDCGLSRIAPAFTNRERLAHVPEKSLAPVFR